MIAEASGSLEFEASLVYRASSRIARTVKHKEILSQKKTNKKVHDVLVYQQLKICIKDCSMKEVWGNPEKQKPIFFGNG